jgi:hypothetical protein
MAGSGEFDRGIRSEVFRTPEGDISIKVSWTVEKGSVLLMVL